MTDVEVAGLSRAEAELNFEKLQSADEWLACYTGMNLHSDRSQLYFPQVPRTKQLIWYFGVEKMKEMEDVQIQKANKKAEEAALREARMKAWTRRWHEIEGSETGDWDE